jgi:DNA-directed RNA polymerase specialized sigma24 family protein
MLPAFLEDGHRARHPLEWVEPADRLLERREVREFVMACIDRPPDSYLTVLVPRDIEELDTEEIAPLLETRIWRSRAISIRASPAVPEFLPQGRTPGMPSRMR